MRLRVLETSAGPVLVLDGLTEQRVAHIAGVSRPSGEAPYVLGIVGDVEIPESDNYHPPASAKPTNPLIERLRRQGVSL